MILSLWQQSYKDKVKYSVTVLKNFANEGITKLRVCRVQLNFMEYFYVLLSGKTQIP